MTTSVRKWLITPSQCLTDNKEEKKKTLTEAQIRRCERPAAAVSLKKDVEVA